MKTLLKNIDAWFSRRWGWFFTHPVPEGNSKEESKKEDESLSIEDPPTKQAKAVFNATGRNANLFKSQQTGKLKN